jgi:tetratricopeptide (TPR) repeat protein
MESPTVFISYSHDSPEHEAKVLALANSLGADGIDAVLDQFESFPPKGWDLWGQRQIQAARFVLVVCTATYRRRFDGEEEPGKGLGAISEAWYIRQLLYKAGGVNEKFLPVLLTDADSEHIPLKLQGYHHFSLNTAQGYEELRLHLTGQSRVRKPALPPKERKSDYLYWNLPPRNSFFTGRDEFLNNLEHGLGHGRAQAISGLGGIGKTQTAIEYAYRHRDQYRAVLWSLADSRDALVSGFGAIASVLDLPEKDERDANVVAEAVRRWLERQTGWLLILDNVEEMVGVVKPFLPASETGHVLMTTRLQATGAIAQNVELEKMEPEEGALFLLRRAKLIAPDAPLDAASEDHKKPAREITGEVAGLPLALDQAAAYIEETPTTPAKYLKLYRTEGAALRDRRGNQATEHDSVTVTFSLAFAQVEKANPAAADLVRACAFLAPDAIPEEIFIQGGKELGEPLAQAAGKPLAWDAAVEAAGRFRLIHRNAANDTLNIHRLVQEVLKDGMDAPTRRLWAERVVLALNQVFPYVEFQNWPQCERLIPHAIVAGRLVDDFGLDFVAAGRLLNESGRYLDRRARYGEAEPLYQLALAIKEKALGPDHPSTATSLNNLAGLHDDQGRYVEAEPLYQRALTIDEKASGPDHPDTAVSLNNLALLFKRQGRYGEAEPLYLRALAICEKALGPDHPDTVQSVRNYALFLRKRGRAAEAEKLEARFKLPPH